MTKIRALVLLAALPLLLMLPVVASAQQAPPHVFTGTVSINGLPAPIGTTMTASIDGVVQGSTTVQAGGIYTLIVDQDNGGVISFKAGNLVAAESATWEQGGATVLNLNARGAGTQDSVINQDDDDANSFKAGGLVAAEGATGDQEGGTVPDLNARGAGTQDSVVPPGPQSANGDTGDPGQRSPTVPAGAEGPAGPAGAPGAEGPAGPAGAPGAVGPAGAPGAVGPPGSAGPAVNSGVLGLTSLIVAIIALVGAAVVYFMPRRSGKAKLS